MVLGGTPLEHPREDPHPERCPWVGQHNLWGLRFQVPKRQKSLKNRARARARTATKSGKNREFGPRQRKNLRARQNDVLISEAGLRDCVYFLIPPRLYYPTNSLVCVWPELRARDAYVCPFTLQRAPARCKWRGLESRERTRRGTRSRARRRRLAGVTATAAGVAATEPGVYEVVDSPSASGCLALRRRLGNAGRRLGSACGRAARLIRRGTLAAEAGDEAAHGPTESFLRVRTCADEGESRRVKALLLPVCYTQHRSRPLRRHRPFPRLTGGVLVGAQPAVHREGRQLRSTRDQPAIPLYLVAGAYRKQVLRLAADEHTSRDRRGIGCGGSNGSAEIDAGSALSTDSGVGDTGGMEARESRPCEWSRSGRPQRGPVLHLSPYDRAGWPSPCRVPRRHILEPHLARGAVTARSSAPPDGRTDDAAPAEG